MASQAPRRELRCLKKGKRLFVPGAEGGDGNHPPPAEPERNPDGQGKECEFRIVVEEAATAFDIRNQQDDKHRGKNRSRGRKVQRLADEMHSVDRKQREKKGGAIDDHITEEIDRVLGGRGFEQRFDVRLRAAALVVIQPGLERLRNGPVDGVCGSGDHLPVNEGPVCCSVDHHFKLESIIFSGDAVLAEMPFVVIAVEGDGCGHEEKRKQTRPVIQRGCKGLFNHGAIWPLYVGIKPIYLDS